MYLVKSCQWLEVIILAEVQHEGEQTEDLSVETELQEEPVVVFSHTVIDPGTKQTEFKIFYMSIGLTWPGLKLQRDNVLMS